VLALAGLLSLLVVGTGSGSPAPLRIAVEGPQTGSQAANGLGQLRGVRLAVNQLNAHGGLWNGRKVSIFRADDKAEASRGKAVAHQVIAKGMATRLRKALLGDGASVTWISVKETTAALLSSTYYADKVSKALGTKPDVVYVSTYFPEGVRIAKALAKAGTNPPCLMGLANVDNAFVAKTSLSQAQRCVFSGVPAATEMPSAKAYVGQYRAAFGKKPSVWGSFTYDSARILFRAVNRAKSFDFAKVERALRRTKGFHGATGTIAINARTGYRKAVPVSILRVNKQKRFVLAK
jgi:ABC-type branched-subunit amino acid transport system substrate-binding protein